MASPFSFSCFMFLPMLLFSQTSFTVEGTVSDETGEFISGASILIKESQTVVPVDFDGKFTLPLKSSRANLEFSCFGYKTRTINVIAGSTYHVKLTSELYLLDEVVLVGYGSVNKQDQTSAIGSVKPPVDIANLSEGVEAVLQGQTAGVQVSANGSKPGTSISVKIRGLNSLTNSSEPLYVVDGILIDAAVINKDRRLGNPVIYQGGLSGIDPSDIKSIRVLKDASALAIYGSRGSNGVVIVTTNKGIKVKPNLIIPLLLLLAMWLEP